MLKSTFIKPLLLSIFASFLYPSLHAQVKLGFTLGINEFNNFAIDQEGLILEPITTGHIGLAANFQINKKFSAETIFNYSEKGFQQKNFQGRFVKNKYMNSQFIIKYHVLKKLKVITGPEINILPEPALRLPSVVSPPFDLGVILGLEYSPIKVVTLSARYHWNLINPISLVVIDSFSLEGPISVDIYQIKIQGFSCGLTIYPFMYDDLY